MKVFIVGGDHLIQRMFTNRGNTMVDNPMDADLLCFTGGADVYPTLYGHPLHPTTRYNISRDMEEKRIFEEFRDKKKVGICRGAQFLNVMSGGKLWQDVDRHAIGDTHLIRYLFDSKYNYNFDREEDNDPNDRNKVIAVTSTHHQMMKPDKDTSELWGYITRSQYRDVGDKLKRRSDYQYSPDVEIVWYPETKSMCFQPHPEYGVKSCEDLFFTCIKRAFGAEAELEVAA